MKVRDAMSPEVQLCTPDDTLKDAAEAMAALGVGLLPVTDNECLVGMISDRDIAIRGVALGRGPDSRVGDVMTAESSAEISAFVLRSLKNSFFWAAFVPIFTSDHDRRMYSCIEALIHHIA